jgi:hypothetical protein
VHFTGIGALTRIGVAFTLGPSVLLYGHGQVCHVYSTKGT